MSSSILDSAFPEKKENRQRHVMKAVYSYTPENEDELELKVNDIIEFVDETEKGWFKGSLNGQVGVFPSNYVIECEEDILDALIQEQDSKQKTDSALFSPSSNQPVLTPHRSGSEKQNITSIVEKDSQRGGINCPKKPLNARKSQSGSDSCVPQLPPKPVREQAKVLYPYQALNADELSLKEGDIITIISKEVEDKGWWKGELNNNIGVFPDNFVELLKSDEGSHQKKPERPEKPSLPVLPKGNAKSEQQEKSPFDKKVAKTPPAKPPPPEVLKKDEQHDRPVPRPHLSKKPQVPPPVKKPLRSSLGAKFQIPLSSPTQTDSSVDLTDAPPSLSPSADSNVSGKLTSPKSIEKNATSPNLFSDSKNWKEETQSIDLDVLSSADKLVHLTANRAKLPNRRPPSQLFLKENDKVNGFVETNSLQEIIEAQSKQEVKKEVQISSESTTTVTEVDTKCSSMTVMQKEDVKTGSKSVQEMKSHFKSVQKELDVRSSGKSIQKETEVKPTGKNVLQKETDSKFSSKPVREELERRQSGTIVQKKMEVKSSTMSIQKEISSQQTVLEKSQLLSQRQSFPSAQRSDIVNRVSKTDVSEVVMRNRRSSPSPQPIPSTKGGRNSMGKTTDSVLSTGTAAEIRKTLEAEIEQLKTEIKILKETTVPRKEFEQLLSEVSELKETLFQQQKSFQKQTLTMSHFFENLHQSPTQMQNDSQK